MFVLLSRIITPWEKGTSDLLFVMYKRTLGWVVMACMTLVVAGLLASCKTDKGPQEGEVAAQTAKIYYDQLLKGQYEQYFEGKDQPKKVPESYRKQMIALYKVYISRQDSLHQGIDSVTINDAKYSAKNKTANVFLTLHFGDATQEEVLVPMVRKNGTWYMR